MTFDPFGDFETEGYLRNSLKLKDPVEERNRNISLSKPVSKTPLLIWQKRDPSTIKRYSKLMKYCLPVSTHGQAKTGMSLFPTSRFSKDQKKIRITHLSSDLS